MPHQHGASLEQRKKTLDMIGAELIERSAEIGRILAIKRGKTIAEGMGGVFRSGQFFQYSAEETLRYMGEITDSVRLGVDLKVRLEPLCVIGIITPWNFPMAVAAWKLAPALAFGNTVGLKPAELVPASARILVKIISRSGLPKGVFNLVMGPGREVGEAISTSKNIDAVTFTGSVPVDRHLASNAIKNMAKIQLEMGSKNALVVLNDADLNVAVQCAINGAFFGTGQKCTASSRLIVEKDAHDDFIEMMTVAMQKLKVGNLLAEAIQIGIVVDEKQYKQVLEYIEIA